MKNIFLLAILLWCNSYLFGQDFQFEIELCEEENETNIIKKNGSIFTGLNIFNQPPSGPAPSGPGDRIIFWVHGFGGNEDRWAVAADEIRDTRNVTSLLPTYSQYSLDVAAGELHDNHLVPLGIPNMIANQTADPMENFIIAHSAGGIVSRATDAFYIDEGYANQDRMFGGIVTFGSPHEGALIANKIDEVLAFGTQSCIDLGDGPRAEAFNANWFIDIWVNSQTTKEALDQLCQFAGNQILPIVLSDFQAGLAGDLAVGAPALADWIYDDILNLDNLFGFGEDDASEVRNAYYKGWQWWLNVNESFKTLTGAIEFQESGTSFLCECTQEDYQGNITGFFTNEVDNEADCNYSGPIDCQVTEITNFVKVEHPTDGIVLASSAMAYPGADAGPDNAMHGSNHLQMRNDSNCGARLNELLAGDHGPYFQTD